MDIADLQQRVALLPGLLATQRETIERLLFQLAFNEQPQFVIAANTGAGKSTLLMALAELFSAQFNVAMLRSDVSEQEVNAQLMQQWFAIPALPEQHLAQQVEAAAATSSPLLLLVDDAERFSTAKMQELATLPAICICFSKPDSALAGTYLTLPTVSLQDAAQLLQHETLNSFELAERHARANGNIHLLLLPLPQRTAAELSKPYFLSTPFYLLATALLVLLSSVIGYGVWQSQAEHHAANEPASKKADTDPALTRMPEMALPKEAQSATTKEMLPPTTGTAAEVKDMTSSTVADGIDNDSSSMAAIADDDTISLPIEANTMEPGRTDDAGAVNTESLTSVSDHVLTAEKTANAATEVAQDVVDPAVSAATNSEPEVIAQQPVLSFLYDEAELLSYDKKQFALQLTVLTNDRAVQRFSRSYPDLSLKRYQRNWQGQMQIIVLLAPFTSAAEAKRAVAGLPATLKNAGPFVKSLQAVQAEIRAREVSQNNGAAQ